MILIVGKKVLHNNFVYIVDEEVGGRKGFKTRITVKEYDMEKTHRY